jgi:hypothetical protein
VSSFRSKLSEAYSRYPRAYARGTLAEVICFSSSIHPRADARGPLRTVDSLTPKISPLLPEGLSWYFA